MQSRTKKMKREGGKRVNQKIGKQEIELHSKQVRLSPRSIGVTNERVRHSQCACVLGIRSACPGSTRKRVWPVFLITIYYHPSVVFKFSMYVWVCLSPPLLVCGDGEWGESITVSLAAIVRFFTTRLSILLLGVSESVRSPMQTLILYFPAVIAHSCLPFHGVTQE